MPQVRRTPARVIALLVAFVCIATRHARLGDAGTTSPGICRRLAGRRSGRTAWSVTGRPARAMSGGHDDGASPARLHERSLQDPQHEIEVSPRDDLLRSVRQGVRQCDARGGDLRQRHPRRRGRQDAVARFADEQPNRSRLPAGGPPLRASLAAEPSTASWNVGNATVATYAARVPPRHRSRTSGLPFASRRSEPWTFHGGPTPPTSSCVSEESGTPMPIPGAATDRRCGTSRTTSPLSAKAGVGDDRR